MSVGHPDLSRYFGVDLFKRDLSDLPHRAFDKGRAPQRSEGASVPTVLLLWSENCLYPSQPPTFSNAHYYWNAIIEILKVFSHK